MPKKTYTVKEVSDLLGFSTNTVYKYLDEGKIKATRLGKEGRFRISADEINRLVPESRETVSPQAVDIPASGLLGLPRIMNAPSLFDWFTSVLAVTLGASEFLFPVYSLDIAFQPYILPV